MSEDSSALTPQVVRKERALRHSREMLAPHFRDIDFQHGVDSAFAACGRDMGWRPR